MHTKNIFINTDGNNPSTYTFNRMLTIGPNGALLQLNGWSFYNSAHNVFNFEFEDNGVDKTLPDGVYSLAGFISAFNEEYSGTISMSPQNKLIFDNNTTLRISNEETARTLGLEQGFYTDLTFMGQNTPYIGSSSVFYVEVEEISSGNMNNSAAFAIIDDSSVGTLGRVARASIANPQIMGIHPGHIEKLNIRVYDEFNRLMDFEGRPGYFAFTLKTL